MTSENRCTLCGQEVVSMMTHVPDCPMFEHTDFDTAINGMITGLMAEFPADEETEQ